MGRLANHTNTDTMDMITIKSFNNLNIILFAPLGFV